jgi:hypothetical protein
MVRQLSAWMLGLLCMSCATDPKPLPDAQALVGELRQRVHADAVDSALKMLPPETLLIPLPAPPSDRNPETLDADAPEFWQSSALAHGPEVHRALFALRASVAAANGAGSPEAVMTETEIMRSPEGITEWQPGVGIDLLALLGLGKSAAASALGLASVRRDEALLAEALWAAPFEADRGRIRVAAARANLDALDALVLEATQDQDRIMLLQAHGRLAETSVYDARTMFHRLLELRTDARAELARARATLASACGLAPDAPPLQRISLASIDDFDVSGGVPRTPNAEVIFAARPDLKRMGFEYALSEAELRLAVQGYSPTLVPSWKPSLAKGLPTAPGGMVAIDLPWPTRVHAEVEAALIRRDAAGVAYVDAANAAWNDVLALRREMEAAYENWSVHVPIVDTATASAWTAARKRFALDRDALLEWIMALERRMEGLEMIQRHREHALILILDYLQALGPRKPESQS